MEYLRYHVLSTPIIQVGILLVRGESQPSVLTWIMIETIVMIIMLITVGSINHINLHSKVLP